MTSDWFCVFFFQAEDGIRDLTVTGVQTCALPIWRCFPRSRFRRSSRRSGSQRREPSARSSFVCRSSARCERRRRARFRRCSNRSEERRVGEEGRSRWWPDHLKKKKKTKQVRHYVL